MQTRKRWGTYMQAALTETGWLLPNSEVSKRSEVRKRSRYARPGQVSFDECSD